MRIQNVCFHGERKKIFSWYHILSGTMSRAHGKGYNKIDLIHLVDFLPF